ncbi:hypothetical protein EVG20_g1544 [Dentipellis fragilis]|uniref:Protein kinase domain-containing protein n=1 Tax=Dentipellis fragilis TaxID=205917 RepID=A0A4Y9ZBX0_9AGAM|nr:hypothetical protein EVG20_g1544 [Dentipellis fragilis]
MSSNAAQTDTFEARMERVFGPETELDRRFAEDPGIVAYGETWWRDHYESLSQLGYILRPRYHPKWTPPWRATGRHYTEYEEGHRRGGSSVIMDAMRASDGTYVTLKKLDFVHSRSSTEEVDINNYLSSHDLLSDPRNHCARAIQILQMPDEQNVYILVMPLLRPFDDPGFTTIGEAVAFFTQIFEGLQFLHEHRVAHRDCCEGNILMDATPMYPEPWHPVELKRRRDWKGKAQHWTRTEHPVKYYYIDYGLSQHFKSDSSQTWPPLTLPAHGGDKTAPENQQDKWNTPCNPFATDIYYLGNLIRESFMQNYYGFGFMKKLVADMVKNEPSKRPEINEVVTRFAKIRESLHAWKLRSRAIPRKEWKIVTLWRYPQHIAQTIRFVVMRRRAIPDP